MKDLGSKIKRETILFFDLDGTLVETDYANFLAYSKAVNIVLGRKISYNPDERFTRAKLTTKFLDITKAQFDSIIKAKEKFFSEFLPQTILNEELYDILNKFSKTNRVFLVTNCRKNRALLTLRYYNLENKFEKLFFRESSKDRKINKFKSAISALGVTPQMIVVFENEEAEILDAIDAGIPEENIIKRGTL